MEKPKAPQRAVAGLGGEEICGAPIGKLKQCSYSCEGNPPGETRCRTDLKDVACVRRICNGNGQWSETKRLPASENTHCLGTKPVVHDCDAYW